MKATRIVAVAVGLVALALIAFGWVTQELLNGMKRSHVKRTMADIRTVADAWEARAAKVHTFDLAPRKGNGPVAVSFADLRRELEPTYIRRLPQRDIWNWDLRFSST